MKKNLRVTFILVIVTTLLCCLLVGCMQEGDKSLQKFYDKVKESQELIDNYADDIYQCWYEAIYKDKYLGDINVAIAYATLLNEDSITAIEQKDKVISELYSEIKNSESSEEVKSVMIAYSDYYEFVINVSGSFKSFSADKENKKKTLATALRNLYYTL